MSGFDWSPLWISIKTAFAATLISFILGMLAARFVMYRKKERTVWVLDGLFTLPLVLPPTVTGFLLLIIFSPVRPFGKFLQDVFHIRLVQTWPACVIAAAAGTVVISFVLLLFVVPRFAELDSTRSLFRAANERGFTETQVFNLHTISHNAEFYASGRLLRDDAGKLKRLYGVTEVKEAIERSGQKTALVLVPLEYLPEIMRYTDLNSEKLGDNGEVAIVVSSLK